MAREAEQRRRQFELDEAALEKRQDEEGITKKVRKWARALRVLMAREDPDGEERRREMRTTSSEERESEDDEKDEEEIEEQIKKWAKEGNEGRRARRMSLEGCEEQDEEEGSKDEDKGEKNGGDHRRKQVAASMGRKAKIKGVKRRRQKEKVATVGETMDVLDDEGAANGQLAGVASTFALVARAAGLGASAQLAHQPTSHTASSALHYINCN